MFMRNRVNLFKPLPLLALTLLIESAPIQSRGVTEAVGDPLDGGSTREYADNPDAEAFKGTQDQVEEASEESDDGSGDE